MSDESRQRGLEMIQEVYQGRVNIDPDLTPHQAATVDHVFGEIWSRPGLDIRDRRLVIIGVLGMLGKSETLETQFGAALDRGELTPEQIHEIVLQLAHYVGWPLAGAAARAAERVTGVKRPPQGP
jgi:4-carboxymuconolactone decarboxylase